MDDQRPILDLEDELAYFKTIPWCRAYLSQDNTIALPRLEPKTKYDPKHSDALFRYTLNAPRAISHTLVAFRDPSTTSPQDTNPQTPWLPVTES